MLGVLTPWPKPRPAIEPIRVLVAKQTPSDFTPLNPNGLSVRQRLIEQNRMSEFPFQLMDLSAGRKLS